jgi:mannose-1-phosphate guanylyltransferase/mannose-6-phosphate isomerase
MAALALQQQFGEDVLMLVMPADHLIDNESAFAAAVADAAALAEKGYLVTFGVHPTHAETGYGYIRSGAAIENSSGFEVAAFVEKPDLATAKEYLASGDYQWNSGMFCFSAAAVLAALKECASDVFDSVETCFAAMEAGTDPMEIPPDSFADCPSISIDYAVMERARRCAMVSGNFGWSDIGSWKAISELYESDDAGNQIRGKAVLVETENCYVQSEDRLVAVVGVNDLVIVDTGDAVLVADRDRSQEVKQVVDHLTRHDHEAAIFHKTVHRPWGSFTILEDADDCKVKRLVVKPGQVLSLQSHQRRAEHWTVVRGTAKVRVGDDEFLLNANQSTYIPVKTLHRLENPGTDDVHLIEVQTGDYFGEDDIERFEDIYGRT